MGQVLHQLASYLERPRMGLGQVRLPKSKVTEIQKAPESPEHFGGYVGAMMAMKMQERSRSLRPEVCSLASARGGMRRVPLQLGVATPLGTEAIIHAVRQWLVRNTGSATKVLLKVDFENAFNVLDRPELLRQVRAHLPGLAPWVEWCYGAHSRLLCDGAALTSESGVQQGDPLGPLLFALTLQPALLAAAGGRSTDKPDITSAFLDDVLLAGDYRQVATALQRLTAAATCRLATKPR